MSRFKFLLFAFVFSLMAGNLFADCLATVDEVKPAQSIKVKAETARDNGDFETAAGLYSEAASAHPQEAYKAVYIMNEIGCLLSTHLDKHGNYSWDKKRGKANAQTAYILLGKVQTLLDTATAQKCVYTSGVIAKTQVWHDIQLKALSSHVPPVANLKIDPAGNIIN